MMKHYFILLAMLFIAGNALAEQTDDSDIDADADADQPVVESDDSHWRWTDNGTTVLPTSEFGDDEALSAGFLTDLFTRPKKKHHDSEDTIEYGRSVNKYATVPVFGGYIIGSYKYSSQSGEHNGAGFNARLVRLYIDGTLLRDFNYRLQLEVNGSPHIKDFYLEWAHWKEFSVKIGQFKRAFTFENPMNPWDVGVGDYSLAVKKLAGMGDRCGEASMGGRDQGLQFQGDLFPISSDKHRLIHYQVAMYNGNGINASDNNKHKDFIGTIQFQPIKGLFIGVFGWTGDWLSNGVTVKRDRYAISAKYDYNAWTARAEYARSFGHKTSDYNDKTGKFDHPNVSDAFYATLGVPVLPWLKIYLKYDQYRDYGNAASKQVIYSLCPNFQLHKNLQIQLQYNYCTKHTPTWNDAWYNKDTYHELWLETYVRF